MDVLVQDTEVTINALLKPASAIQKWPTYSEDDIYTSDTKKYICYSSSYHDQRGWLHFFWTLNSRPTTLLQTLIIARNVRRFKQISAKTRWNSHKTVKSLASNVEA